MAAVARLQGRVALVTGGAKGIGFACARSLARNGAKIVLADVDMPRAQESVDVLCSEGHEVTAIACDVRVRTQVDAAVQHAVSRFGSLDILVANAGIVKAAPFLEMAEQDFDDVIGINLKGCFISCQAAARQMVKERQAGDKKGKAIITMSSVNGVMAIPSIAGYNASKGGVNNLTRCMALALVEHGIRVNAIGPGSIQTDVLTAVANDEAARNRVLSRTPMGRIGDPGEVGSVAAFLASDDASYMTGQVLYVDGGRMAMNYTCPVPGSA
uniref:Ketoreductase domain-containing protein n=1 Tax=Chlamydomonas euryale TaxID=1486919 RepID=A0A7R9W0K8_9CHLO|mmetsp:Transcript_9336/g.28488  ORF Transcript_9336/g.28488 Transcript_9336/m.28488 type:complete len:270 (+) Transcript_9336:134-943(+)